MLLTNLVAIFSNILICKIDSIIYNTAVYNLITKSVVDSLLYLGSEAEGNLSYMPGLILDGNTPSRLNLNLKWSYSTDIALLNLI